MFGTFRLEQLSEHPDNTGKQWIRISFTDIPIHHLPAYGVLVLLVGDTPSPGKMRCRSLRTHLAVWLFTQAEPDVYSLWSLLQHSAQQV